MLYFPGKSFRKYQSVIFYLPINIKEIYLCIGTTFCQCFCWLHQLQLLKGNSPTVLFGIFVCMCACVCNSCVCTHTCPDITWNIDGTQKINTESYTKNESFRAIVQQSFRTNVLQYAWDPKLKKHRVEASTLNSQATYTNIFKKFVVFFPVEEFTDQFISNENIREIHSQAHVVYIWQNTQHFYIILQWECDPQLTVGQ